MLGDFCVGKTSLVQRFVYNRFSENYLSTIGVNISRKELFFGERQVNLLIWDLAGSERLNGTRKGYLQGAAGALLVCDLTRPETIPSLLKYAQYLRESTPLAPVIIIGNKVDLILDGETSDQAIELAASLNAPHLITSAKTGNGVEQAFQKLAELIDGVSN